VANQTTLTFAGDADSLRRAAQQSTQALDSVAAEARATSAELSEATQASQDMTTRLGSLGAATEGAAGALDSIGGSLQAMVDFQNFAADQAMRLKRALNDCAQAVVDYDQALLDGQQAQADANQAAIDAEQAVLDAAVAQEEYNAAVKEHGAGSAEARQASIDLKQAQEDLRQANLDSKQATIDGTQATVDAKGATLDLAEAQKEANPSDMQRWADQLAVITPLVTALVGVIALVTAAQWAWNAAQLASPTTWIVLGIAAIVAGIVLLVSQWDTVKEAGGAAWDWIVAKGRDAWNWLKQIPGWVSSAFGRVGDAISAPFRAAFNAVSRAWNSTIGRLSWTVPGWIPGIGGNTISAPRLPQFHSGGTVPGLPGQEVLAVLQAGETVNNAAGAGPGGRSEKVVYLDLGPALMDIIQREVGARGGDVQIVLGGGRG
jgi:hypothetical protein